MGEYFDKAYVAADGVILFYEDDDVSLNVPKALGDMDIHTVGDGAFMELKSLMYAYVPEGVKTLGEKAFYGCKALKSIAIPRTIKNIGEDALNGCPHLKTIRIASFELDEQKYIEYKSTFMCANGSVYIAPFFPDDEQISSVLLAADIKKANPINDGIIRLFSADIINKKPGHPLDFKESCLAFGLKNSYVSETESIKDLIDSLDHINTDIISEEKNDRFLKNDRLPEIQKTAIFSFDDNKTRHENGKYYIALDIMLGYHFWQSVVPVNREGKKYYVYRRHFLTGEPELNYIRHDSGVYSENGGGISNEEEWLVNAKYRLLSIL